MAILTHDIFYLNVVTAVQLDQVPVNTGQLRKQVIGSELGQDRLDEFGRGKSGTPSGFF